MSRKRHPTIRDGALNLGGADTVTGASAPHGPVFSPPDLGLATQVDRANALARAREEGDKEATIRTMCECIAQAEDLSDCFDTERGIVHALQLELHRRFPGDPRVTHHLASRGLA